MLLADLDGRAHGGDDGRDSHGDRAPIRKAAEGGRKLGWEVPGYDHGMPHSWLCNDLYQSGDLRTRRG
nr:hypothetical protein [Streptomyces sp. TLI_235]